MCFGSKNFCYKCNTPKPGTDSSGGAAREATGGNTKRPPTPSLSTPKQGRGGGAGLWQHMRAAPVGSIYTHYLPLL